MTKLHDYNIIINFFGINSIEYMFYLSILYDI